MPHGIDVVAPDDRQVDGHLFGMVRHRLEGAILPIEHVLADLAKVGVGVEIGGEVATVIAAVHVDDVDRVDTVEMMLRRVSAEHVDDARIEADAEQGRKPFGLEIGFARPLVIRIPGRGRVLDELVLRHRRIEIMRTLRDARIHDRNVAIGRGDVEHDIGTALADERLDRGPVLRIGHRRGDETGPAAAPAAVDIGGDGLEFVPRAACQRHAAKSVEMLRRLMRCNRADTAGTDDQKTGTRHPLALSVIALKSDKTRRL